MRPQDKQRNGLLFYGLSGPANLPLQGGTLCVAPPLLPGDGGAGSTDLLFLNPPGGDLSAYAEVLAPILISVGENGEAYVECVISGYPDDSTVPPTGWTAQFIMSMPQSCATCE